MGGVLKRRPVLRGLAIAAAGLSVLSVASWFLGESVSTEFPQRPLADLGSTGPWVASYARAVAAGSWGAARVCMVLVVLVLVLNTASRLMDVLRRVGRRRGRRRLEAAEA
ncbi:hypothetical protein ACFW2Y_08415 [Streptomyces sp. NPDC058877]|uniref:hypothetical protein n=1 Tax=unclassified Streptomyces TaxID=2593676 RepID=UPI00368A378E